VPSGEDPPAVTAPAWRDPGVRRADGRGDAAAMAGASPATFVLQYRCVEIHPSAHRHGVADEGILHAIEQSMVVYDLGEDPRAMAGQRSRPCRQPSRIVVLITAEGDELIIHAMPLRPVYRKPLDP
jgi:hypothetical protein